MNQILFGLLFSLIAFAPSVASAQDALPRSVQKKIAVAVEDFRQQQHVPGVSVAVGIDSSVVFAQGFGIADLENNVPAGLNTAYRTASIAKPITATAVLQLVEQGKIGLDDTIQKYCPEYPEKEWPITVRQLLCHQSGVRHYNSGREATGTEFFPNIESSITLFAADPLRHEPGAGYTYTTFGYSLLGRAVESASGQPFWQYLQQHVFDSAGMNNSGIDNVRLIIPNRAAGYVFLSQEDYQTLPPDIQMLAKPDQHYNAELHDTSMKVPGGGLSSTAPDLVRFGIGWLDANLINEKTREAAWTAQSTADGTLTDYGLGWGIVGQGAGRQIGHSGGQAGVSTYLLIDPDRKIVVAVMCNLEDTPCRNLARQIATLLP